MLQVLQSLNSGETILEDVPCPKNMASTLLIETTKTLVSAGTERMLLEFGKANLLGKIKQQPDKVKMVFEKIKTDGLYATLNAVRAKLDKPIALGYCNVGHVIEVGKNIVGFSVGDRVISNGHHAEIVRVPKNCCAKIPDTVSDEEAAFVVVSAISLQGIRLSQPTLGERYVVFGLGLIGLLTVQLLKAHGCRVLGVDFDSEKCALAKEFGAEISHPDNIILDAEIFSRGNGIDAVIITAATNSDTLLHQAATICRKRARIILIGVIGNTFSRADFYEKELSFQVSCSYGPGRYDENYEKNGYDYPIGFVRFTMQRNFEAILDMMSVGKLNVMPLISHCFTIENVFQAYETLEHQKSVLGILIDYPADHQAQKTKTNIVIEHKNKVATKLNSITLGFIGAGNYAATTLVPAFKQSGVVLDSIVSSEGVNAKRLAKKWNFKNALTDDQCIFSNALINLVVIATRHNLHANQVIQAIETKHVFVEKPLAIYAEELEKIRTAYEKNKNYLLMVGFNRRFSPLIQTIKKLLLAEQVPAVFIMTVNAGNISKAHWVHNLSVGGGRVLGEACHFIDLLCFLAGNPVEKWNAVSAKTEADVVTVTLYFSNGSHGTIHYFANGHQLFPKERLEVFCNGKILQLDNFRQLKGLGWKHFKKQKCRRQDKGQIACVQAFVDAIYEGKSSPISFEEIMEVSRLSIEISEYLRC